MKTIKSLGLGRGLCFPRAWVRSFWFVPQAKDVRVRLTDDPKLTGDVNVNTN